jgi:DNA-binding transcriptional MerR regulator
MTKEPKDLLTQPDLAKAVGMTRQGIDYYETLGLIEPVVKSGHFRFYSPTTLERILKIKELQKDYKLSAIVQMVKDGKL